jgi:hypothetical protein
MLALHELQVYCDYNVETYVYADAGVGSPALRETFYRRWTMETHTGLLLPMTVRILIELERVDPDRSTPGGGGVQPPKYNLIAIDLDVKLGVKVAIDCRQCVVIAGIVEHMHDFQRITDYRRQFGYIRVWDLRTVPPPSLDLSAATARGEQGEKTHGNAQPLPYGSSKQQQQQQTSQTSQTQTQRSWWQSKRSVPRNMPAAPSSKPPELPRQQFSSTRGGGYIRDVQPSTRDSLGSRWPRKLWWYAFECVKFDLRQHLHIDFLHKLLEKGHLNRKRIRYTSLYKKHLRKVEEAKRVAAEKASPIMTMLSSDGSRDTHGVAEQGGVFRLEDQWVLHDLEQQLDLGSVLKFRQMAHYELYDERLGVGAATTGAQGFMLSQPPAGAVPHMQTKVAGGVRSGRSADQLVVPPLPKTEVDDGAPAMPQFNFFVKDIIVELREPIIVVSQQQILRLEREVGLDKASPGVSMGGVSVSEAGSGGVRGSLNSSDSGGDHGSGKPGMRTTTNMTRKKLLQAKMCSVRGNVMAERDYLQRFATSQTNSRKANARGAKPPPSMEGEQGIDRGASPWASPNGAGNVNSDGKGKGIHFFLAELKLGSLTVQHWPTQQGDGGMDESMGGQEDVEAQEHPIFTGARSSEVNNEFMYVGIKMDPHGFTAVPAAPSAAGATAEAADAAPEPPSAAKVWGWRVLVAVGPIAVDNHLAARHHLGTVLCTGGSVARSVVQ